MRGACGVYSVASMGKLVLVLLWLISAALAGDAYPNRERIGLLRAPVLIMHGEEDELVPVAHARALFDAAREPRRLKVVPGAGHNDLVQRMGPSYGTEVAGWLT